MGGARPIDPRPRGAGAARVERDADYLKTLRMQLVSEFPPPGQIEAATSPGRPRDHEDLRAPKHAQRKVATVAVLQDDVRKLRTRERPAARLRAKRPQSVPPRRAPAPCRADPRAGAHRTACPGQRRPRRDRRPRALRSTRCEARARRGSRRDARGSSCCDESRMRCRPDFGARVKPGDRRAHGLTAHDRHHGDSSDAPARADSPCRGG
jgi:hypothetical protein